MRPFTTVTYAQTLDGSIATADGSPLAISSPASMKFTHRLRSEHDAILVGIGTVLADDPQLTVRLVQGAHPQPIIIDSRLRTPPRARLCVHPNRRPWVITTMDAPRSNQNVLESIGVRVLRVPCNADGKVCLRTTLDELSKLGVSSLMVEGGQRILTEFLAHGLTDRLIVTIAPQLTVGLRALQPIQHSWPLLSNAKFHHFGQDLIFEATVTHSVKRCRTSKSVQQDN
jgi:GTP cyclohydrolase II